jgi:hypothetical protein
MDITARPHGGLATLRRTYAGRTVANTTGGSRRHVSHALPRPFVKENQK